ncbi:nicotinamide phosphoribosyltransferase-like [Oppia nitens]|uniref:nicotinamide phosphoribosyltransferase-like n=1 Tax=Oppia nitens TaxID=1686743 RepID=UPI0023DBD6E7|nr:nicotinamide phosphoribosyltransferase-like [Oppia nitens]
MSYNPCDNIILITDSYKITHWKQYPPKTTKLYSYFESRGGKFDNTVFFGLQYILKRYLCGQVVTGEKITEAKHFCRKHFQKESLFNEKGWQHIVDRHNGYLPLRIRAVPEGSVIPTHNVLFTVENTDPDVPWITNWFETLLLQCWYPMTVATLSREQKVIISQYMYETADSLDKVVFQLHDFGYRGVSSVEQAAIGGAAHLVNFKGTDTLAGIQMIDKYYSEEMAGFSVPATEHSTMTTWAAFANPDALLDGELKACEHMLKEFPDGIISVVSDSYDIYECCEKIWGDKLKDMVIERGNTSGNVLVIRPDSGNPVEVLPKILDILYKAFKNDCHINSKQFKVLPNYLRIIQGDAINIDSLKTILDKIKECRFSIENLVFGSGGSLLMRVHRDTNRCAFKCSYAEIDGRPINVYKDPKTDPNKTSKKGILSLEFNEKNQKFITHEEQQDPNKKIAINDLLETVFQNGKLIKEYTFQEIRERAKVEINGHRI